MKTNGSPKTDRLGRVRHEADVCVIGGGMAGMCAAIAAARHGAKTILIHDRPVYGGNASSEVRMWICGAHGDHNKETGLLEEVQLENSYRNAALNYSVWDSVLYGKVHHQPNLTPLLNCSVADATTEATSGGGGRITAVHAWQLTSQTWHTVHAKHYIDCSGDSILAAVTPAEFRVGREARHEFSEDIQPAVGDGKTMGNSLLIQIRKTDSPQPFTPPRWAYRFDSPEDLPHRMHGVKAHNFWWIEVGGLQNTIGDAEAIRDELMRIVWGVWDYIKNRSPAPGRDEAANWAVEWVGSLPGKRENRRYVGDHVLTQNDIRAGGASGGAFDDIIAYGGWSMDDHHPAGLYYPGKPTIFHPAPSPYGIPYRSLYSRNITNLLFAGRNISVTHAALSSTRVMATCALLGQAAGTAAGLCVQRGCDPRALSSGDPLRQLQRTLMDDDCWLPGVNRPASELALSASLAGSGDGLPLLLDGLDRDRKGESHAYTGPMGQPIEFRWDHAVQVGGLRAVLDSNLQNDKRMPCSYPQRGDRCLVPGTLLKAFRVEAEEPDGSWRTIHRENENYQRLVKLPLQANTRAIRFVPEESWGTSGGDAARLFALEPVERIDAAMPHVERGPHFRNVRARVAAEDLAAPDSGLETPATPFSHTA